MADQPSRDPRSSPSPPAADDQHVLILTPRARRAPERYDLEQLFLEWAWGAGFPAGWTQSVRALARSLTGLQRAGLVQRRTVRRAGHPTHHGFVLTDLGRAALVALSGEWISEGSR